MTSELVLTLMAKGATLEEARKIEEKAKELALTTPRNLKEALGMLSEATRLQK